MIAVLGEPNVTLKRIMRGEGFPQFAPPDFGGYGRASVSYLSGIFNCSYSQSRMRDLVLSRFPWVQEDFPIINKNLVTDKLEAQRKMEANGLSEHILVYRQIDPSLADHDRDPDRWVVKPYASQGGVGIRGYEGGLLRSGFYLQKRINKVREFRAHVGLWLDNPVFTIQEKKPKPELWESLFGNENTLGYWSEYEWPTNEARRDRLPLTWNIDSGFYMRRTTTPENRGDKVRRFPLLGRVEDVAIKAVKALGYQYGAVDILMDDNRWLWVVEINSHPAILNPTSVEIYKEVLEPLKTTSKLTLSRLVSGVEQPTTTNHVFTRGEGIV